MRFHLWLRNGTSGKAHRAAGPELRHAARASGFAAQSLTNKVFQPPFAAVRSDDGRRWMITVWERCDRGWGNDQVPCIHSDPIFPDCGPGETVRVRGWLSFYEGQQIDQELKRIEATGWRK